MRLLVPVKGFDGYFISDLGAVFKENEKGFLTKVTTNINHGGYHTVQIRKNGKSFSRRIHILSWTSFIGKIPTGYQVNHDKGLKHLNGIFELSLMTQEQNLKHSRETGLRKKPKVETKLDEIKVLTLYTCKKSHKRKDLVTYTGTTIRNVEMILAGHTRKKLYQQVMSEKS